MLPPPESARATASTSKQAAGCAAAASPSTSTSTSTGQQGPVSRSLDNQQEGGRMHAAAAAATSRPQEGVPTPAGAPPAGARPAAGRSPRPSTTAMHAAAEALPTEYDGVRLILSTKSPTGYRGVTRRGNRFNIRVGPMREYRWFDTAVAAAACYARARGGEAGQPGGAGEHAAEEWEDGVEA